MVGEIPHLGTTHFRSSASGADGKALVAHGQCECGSYQRNSEWNSDEEDDQIPQEMNFRTTHLCHSDVGSFEYWIVSGGR
jgi:hypothetical protein